MKGTELAASLRKLADAVEPYDEMPKVKAELPEDLQLGAAAMVDYLRSLFTGAGKDIYTRDEILVLLNLIQNDPEIFSMDIIAAFEKE